MLLRRQAVWVNTIMRPPRLNLATLRRGWEKARQWLRPRTPHDALPANLSVCNPKMWPWLSSGFDRRLNRWLLRRQLRSQIEAMPNRPVAITTLPITADLIGELPVLRWVYYCVDDFSVWPGLDGSALQRMEQRLVQKADTIIAVSEILRDKMSALGRCSHLLTHGFDADDWNGNGDSVAIPALANLERPLLVFWGVVDRRIDLQFVRQLAGDLERGTIVFAGPHNEPDSELLKVQRTVFTGPLQYEQLPALARKAAVLIMPYADLPVTRAIQPLKLKEYLATGKPVVVRDLPATREWTDCLDAASTAADFSRFVRERIGNGIAESQLAVRARLANETWDAKARAFESWIDPQPAAALAY
jgi:glycosyltransferase involved in cell wall biosynthesis